MLEEARHAAEMLNKRRSIVEDRGTCQVLAGKVRSHIGVSNKQGPSYRPRMVGLLI